MRILCAVSWLLKEYQTLFVGLIGFGGVIITLRMNAKLNREQHTRQIEHERTALKAALSAELTIIRDTYVDRINTIDEGATQSMLVPLDTMTGVYGKVMDKIGLLTRDQVNLVLRAYLLVQQMPVRLKFFEGPEEIQLPVDGYLRIQSKHIGHVRQIHENFLVDINAAIAALA